ncbi:PREDICTED: UDP-glucuronosyltransferase 2B1-like isoform X2 [Wasmannia auropunctata]|uniref:UDP-glucuronosyltransferase 2B1-like isoform X2 n=1 Tax=Wasmannia auropunctata TaxID=64793 RepID=UPI0005ED589E|nr:PREDICTED: UDP-glucuronosyltransferase 2B1-like isoform X2 [Wasmannia auropunctata]
MTSCSILLFHLVCCTLMGRFVTSSKPLSILLLQSVPSTSHHIWAANLVKGLLRKGHHVHVVSTHETKVEGKLAENLTYKVFDGMMSSDDYEDYGPAQWEKYSVLHMAYITYQWAIYGCYKAIKTNTAKELLEMIKTVEFDVIVQDITLHQCFYGLWEVAKGKPPIVGFMPLAAAPWLKDFVGGLSYPTVRTYVSSAMAKPVGLWQRTLNTLYYIADDLLRHYYFLPIVQLLAEEYVGNSLRPLHEIEKNDISIVLINSHCATEAAIPLPPNALEVGGLQAQIVPPIARDVVVKTYPENMRIFLDEAKNGVIVLSLGSIAKWKTFGLDKIKTVILALSKLKQRVLWKLDVEVPFQIPNNVMIMKWIPQRKILSHKNVKAIWNHAGLLSTQEAIWEGIPLIAMPLIMDGKSIAEILVVKGVGIRLEYKTLSTRNIVHAVEQIIYNKSYARNMKRLSDEFRDRPLLPLDLAVWGIEYAVRNPNGSLATPLKSQSWLEQNLIDVYAFLFLNLFIILLIVCFVIKLLINFYCNRRYASKSYKSKQT